MKYYAKCIMFGVLAGFGFDRRKCGNCGWWERHGKFKTLSPELTTIVNDSNYGQCTTCSNGNPGRRMFRPGDEIGPRNDMRITTRRNFLCKMWVLK